MCFSPSQWVASDQKTKPKQKFNYTPKCNFLILLVHVTKFRALDIAGSRHLGKAVNSAPFPIGFLSSVTSLMVSTDTPWLCINTFKPNGKRFFVLIIGQDHGLHLFDQFWICAFSEPIIVSGRETCFDGVLLLSHECVCACVRAGVGEVKEGQSRRKQGLYVALPKHVD